MNLVGRLLGQSRWGMATFLSRTLLKIIGKTDNTLAYLALILYGIWLARILRGEVPPFDSFSSEINSIYFLQTSFFVAIKTQPTKKYCLSLNQKLA